MTTVWASGGRRYHRIARCSALLRGQELHDWDCNEPCGHDHVWPRQPREISETLALAYGLTPCRSCLPGFHTWDSPTFGHEPYEYDGALICQRCYLGDDNHRDFVYWPCTTARVLRLDGPS